VNWSSLMRSIFAKTAVAAAAVTLVMAAPADARSWRHGGHHYHGGYHHHGGHYYGRHYYNGWGAGLAGFATGALIGGALASQPRYYAAPGYYGGPSAVAYCEQRYRSYDPASGTYLGYDGYRHPCP
jgi:hypothetical protein